MINITLNPLNTNIVDVTGDIHNQVGNYLSSIINSNDYISNCILKILQEQPYITWEKLSHIHMYNATNITFTKNTKESPLQQEWWKDIYNIRFEEIKKENFTLCRYNNINLYNIYELRSTSKSVKIKKFFHKKVTKEFFNSYTSLKKAEDLEDWLKKNIKYKEEKPKINILSHNIKTFFEVLQAFKKENHIKYALEHINTMQMNMGGKNRTWKHKDVFKQILDKYIITYLEIKDKTKIDSVILKVKKQTSTYVDDIYNFKMKIRRIQLKHLLPSIQTLNDEGAVAILDTTNKYEVHKQKFESTIQKIIINAAENKKINKANMDSIITECIYKWSFEDKDTYNRNKVNSIIKNMDKFMFESMERNISSYLKDNKVTLIPEIRTIQKRKLKEQI